MNRQLFISYVNSPSGLNTDTMEPLKNLARSYRWCQITNVLYLLNLLHLDHIDYPQQLRITAAGAPNRKMLKELLNTREEMNRIITSSVHIDQSPQPPAPSPGEPMQTEVSEAARFMSLLDNLSHTVSSFMTTDDYASGSNRFLVIQDIIFKLGEILEMAQQVPQTDIMHEPFVAGEKPADQFPDDKDSKQVASFETQSKADLIENFILSEPRISSPAKTDFFTPEKFAKASLVDKDEIVSETLARIYLGQGNYAKALKIFKKLFLLNPQKSSYFAAQILKIEKEIEQ